MKLVCVNCGREILPDQPLKIVSSCMYIHSTCDRDYRLHLSRLVEELKYIGSRE